RRASPDWQAEPVTLDPRIYHDAERFAAERERLFRRLPLCVGHADQLAEPGSLLAFELCGVPVLPARGRDGTLRAFLNVRRHRGARLVSEQGTVCRKPSIACPYHAGPIDSMARWPACRAPRPFPASTAPSSDCVRCPSP